MDGAPRTPKAARPGRGRGVLRGLAWLLLAIIVLLVLGLAGVTLWAGTSGSLATALRLASHSLPLTARDASGAILGDAQVGDLVWDQDGLRIEVQNAVLDWRPRELLNRRLHVLRLAADRIVISDQRAPSEPAPAAEWPDSLALPFGLRIAVDRIEAGEIRWAGPPPRSVHDVTARYQFDGNEHALDLLGARYQDDDYSASVQVQARAGARAPVPLAVQASGAASARLPDAAQPLLAALQARVDGNLSDMQAVLRLQAAPATAAGAGPLQLPALPEPSASLPTAPALDWPVAGDAQPLRLDLAARITPQAGMPLHDASGELRALNLRALLPQAPESDLAAQFTIKPLAASRSGSEPGWALQAQAVNDSPGPWDSDRLPVDRLNASAIWQDGVATVQDLIIELAGGSLRGRGQWHGAGGDADGDARGSWQVSSQIEHVDPAQLYSSLAAFPVDGQASAQGHGENVDFELSLDAADAADLPTDSSDADAADALAGQLRALALQQLRAQGRLADQLLTLERVQVQTADARLEGHAQVRLADPQRPAVDGSVQLQAPGLALALRANALSADQGTGTVKVDLSDAQAALDWVRRLPVAADALADLRARGSAQLDAEWQDGWLDPTLQAHLAVPQLDATPHSDSGTAGTIQVRALDARASGRLEQARLSLQGQVLQPAHGVDLQLALDGEGGWANDVLTLESLQLQAGDASAGGSATLNLAAAGGFKAEADLKLRAPGLAGTVQGTLAPEGGGGRARLDLSDAAATLRWARTLPGAADALAGATASGTAQLDASWEGGLNDPRVDATLSVPQLHYRPRDADAALAARDVRARLSGDLEQATLSARGRVVQGERRVDLRLAADGGRASQDKAAWRLRVSELAARLRLPELGQGEWQLASRNAVPISWSPANGGQLDVAAGELTITSPAPHRQSRLIWEPVRWRDGQLSSAGRITELPLAWLQRVAQEQLEDAGVSGDIVLGGHWDVRMGQQLKLDAVLERVSGDINVNVNAEGDGNATIAAGLREARVELSSSGNDVRLGLRWDSARAGTVDGQFSTRLTAVQGAGGQTRWQWSDQAPLTGHLKAALPEISVWSLLAPPGWRLHGSLDADVRVSGSAAQPQLSGSLSADDLALRSVVDGVQLEDGRLRAHLQGTRLVIDEFILRGAGEDDSGGSIRVSGEAGLFDGELAVRIQAVIDRLHASVRDDREVIASGKINAALRDQTVSASGTLVVDRARIVLPDESRPTLSSDVFVHGLGQDDRTAVEQNREPGAGDEAAKSRERAREAAEASPLNADIDIRIDMGDDFRLSGMGIDTRLAGKLALTAKGPLAQMPTLNGRVETVGGTFRAYGQHLSIERGRIFFSGDASNPGLDILALRPNYASEQKVGALVQGTALLPQVKLYSQPTLPDDQVLAWLILGHAAPEDGGEAAMMQTAALALLGGRDSEGLASSFGLDELSFGSGNGEGLAGASVTLGKRLSDRLYTAYEHSLSGTGGVLMIFYELSRRWVLRGQASQSSAIDLIYRLSYD